MCYTIALSPRHLVWAALPSVPEYCPGQQTDGKVPVPTQQYKEVPGAAQVGKVGQYAGLESRLPQYTVQDCLFI